MKGKNQKASSMHQAASSTGSGRKGTGRDHDALSPAAKKRARRCMVEIEVYPSDTIEMVKAKICQTGGLTLDQEQRLIFDGVEALDHKQVGHYSIAPGDVVHLIRKER